MTTEIIKTKFGYYELKNKPSKEELEHYYSQKYYQDSKGTYQKSYTKQEEEFILNKSKRKLSIINKILEESSEIKKMLDIGCGEGWALKYFSDNEWNVLGLDYSSYGCQKINPEMKKNIISGDIYENINSLIKKGEKFNAVVLDNVLEHVLEPFELMCKLKQIVSKNGVLIIEVPNDFSVLQEYLLKENHIKKPFWILSPDHISYFNKDGLKNIGNEAGWEMQYLSTDYPIDLNLINENTNYYIDKTKGKSVHFARVEIENLFDQISTDLTNELYMKFAELGLGRNIIAYFTNKNI